MGFVNKIIGFMKWFFIALIVMIVNLQVSITLDIPDWTAFVSIILYLYVFFRYSKMGATVIDLLICFAIFVFSIINSNGAEKWQQDLYDFYVNIGAEIIAGAIMIGIGYAIWKSRKR